MSLIKAADVPQHIAAKLASRRLGSRLSRGVKQESPAQSSIKGAVQDKPALASVVALPNSPAIL